MSDITYTKHDDTRANNPTIENRGFMVEEEAKPYVMRYPRDPSLDPQLVWKGKDEQDGEDLQVQTVPIYRQEHIHPRAMIEEVQRRSFTPNPSPSEGRGEFQLDLFGDFNGIEGDDVMSKFDKEVDFYSHDSDKQKHWTNRMILGDSLLVMNSLAEKEGLKGKVQCIYLDPPYGIKFGSNWQVSTRKRDVKDGKAEDAAREPEVIRAFRDTWKLGIHSYLSYLRDRFRVAQELLTETGSIFVQIGDENVHLVRSVMDEVFGSENFVRTITFATTSGFATNTLAAAADYVLWYAKSIDSVKIRELWWDNSKEEAMGYGWLILADGKQRGMTAAERRGEIAPPEGARLYQPGSIQSSGAASAPQPFEHKGKVYHPTANSHWKAQYPEGMRRLEWAGRLHTAENSIRYVRFADDFGKRALTNIWTDTRTGNFTDEKIYVVQTGSKTIERCILMATDPGDLVLDPTCGSGTTAYVAEQWGRRWITVDTSRVALALARTRLMCARFPYYHLADSPEGVKKESELTGQLPPTYPTANDIKKGFVYKRVPHVTLKSIANNPDIQEGMTREQIDKAIAKHADTEFLYDQPYDDKKRIRVTGPFTVESLSPHRVIASENEQPTDEAEAKRDDAAADFTTMVIENLKKAGVQNTKKGERIKFDTLEPHAGRWVHAVGTYLAPDPSPPGPLSPGGARGEDGASPTGAQTSPQGEGRVVRIAVSIGPEYGAVSPMQIKEAAKEAVQGIGFDLLIVCGYAFDPHVNEEVKQIGQLTILPTRMNADLLMGDDLLKKTGAGNLFMVFGEPDIAIYDVHCDSRDPNGMFGDYVQAEIKGLDVYDPTTGEIRSNSTADIACWFIDTNYNGESFFVRHAYFVGAEVTDKKDGQKYDPYRALRSTLRAEIDPDAWASIYSTKSRLFAKPETGKIAIKVINHYGDEVLKVYEIGTGGG